MKIQYAVVYARAGRMSRPRYVPAGVVVTGAGEGLDFHWKVEDRFDGIEAVFSGEAVRLIQRGVERLQEHYITRLAGIIGLAGCITEEVETEEFLGTVEAANVLFERLQKREIG